MELNYYKNSVFFVDVGPGKDTIFYLYIIKVLSFIYTVMLLLFRSNGRDFALSNQIGELLYEKVEQPKI